MGERVFEIGAINPIEIFGANDVKLNQIRGFYPKLKIVSRGTEIKVIGDNDIIGEFEKSLERIVGADKVIAESQAQVVGPRRRARGGSRLYLTSTFALMRRV